MNRRWYECSQGYPYISHVIAAPITLTICFLFWIWSSIHRFVELTTWTIEYQIELLMDLKKYLKEKFK